MRKPNEGAAGHYEPIKVNLSTPRKKAAGCKEKGRSLFSARGKRKDGQRFPSRYEEIRLKRGLFLRGGAASCHAGGKKKNKAMRGIVTSEK